MLVLAQSETMQVEVPGFVCSELEVVKVPDSWLLVHVW